MNFRILLVCLLLSVSASTAMGAGPYAGFAGGVSSIHDQNIKYPSGSGSTARLRTGYGFSVNAGYDFEPVRIEFEFGFKKADVDEFVGGGGSSSGVGSDTTIRSYMTDVYYDFKNSSNFKPYAGLGLGTVNGEFKSPGFENDDSAFGYQFIVGGAYNLTQNVALDLSYRFQGITSDFRLNNGTEISYTSRNFMAGLRYSF